MFSEVIALINIVSSMCYNERSEQILCKSFLFSYGFDEIYCN